MKEWNLLSSSISALFEPTVVDRLNNLLIEFAQLTENDIEEEQFVQTLLSRYISSGRPLTGYFAVCCVIEIQGTVLAQTLCSSQGVGSYIAPEEAAAANAVWSSLLSQPVPLDEIEDETFRTDLAKTLASALRCYSDLLLQIEELEGDPSLDTYAWETMSESLVRAHVFYVPNCSYSYSKFSSLYSVTIQKLASVCTVTLQDLDSSLFSKLKALLSDTPPVFDSLLQEAALESMTVLVHK